MLRSLILALSFGTLLLSVADAQSSDPFKTAKFVKLLGLVVTSCGTQSLTSSFTQITIDTTGKRCGSSNGGSEVLSDSGNTELLADPTNAFILTH